MPTSPFTRFPVRFRKLVPEAITPQYATDGSAGMDLVAVESVCVHPDRAAAIRTGLAFEIPRGMEGQVRPRSGLAKKHSVTVANSPGTIDSDYRGEVLVLLSNHGKNEFWVSPGDRIAQLVLCPVFRAELQEVESLDDTARGAGGFGSTGT